MKQIKILLIMLLLVFQLNAQYAPTFMNGFDPNYFAINRNLLSPTSGTTGYDDNQKYVATMMNITLKIHTKLMSLNGLLTNPIANPNDLTKYDTYNELLATPAYQYNTIIRANGLIVKKVQYARNHITGQVDPFVRMVVIRPDDNVVRPCIMITNGISTMFNLSSGATYYEYMTDFALRGYTVVFYETLSNDFSTISLIDPTQYPCNITSTNKIGIVFEKNMYASFQYAVAAYNYIRDDANLPLANRIINANINEIHAFGISAGAATSLMLAYSRSNNYPPYMREFFTNNCSSNSTSVPNNNFVKLCLNTTNPISDITIKSVVAGSGFLAANAGNYFANEGSVIPKLPPTIILYGIHDQIPYDLQTTVSIPVISLDSIRKTLKTINKPNKLVVNCEGGHGFVRDRNLPGYNTPRNGENLNNSSVINSTQFPGLFEVINNNDNQTLYNSFILDGLCFRRFINEMAYDFSQVSNVNTMLTWHFKDVRNNNLSSYYNNNPIYVKNPNQFVCSPCLIFADRCGIAGNNVDGHFENSTPCVPDTIVRTNTQFLRVAKSETDTKNKDIVSDEFLMYPNPANNILTIKYTSLNDKNINIRIFNNLGTLLLDKKNNITVGENKLEFNTENLPNGIYLISIENEKEIYSDKFIISR